MVCSVAFITWLFGYMPPPGTIITVPKEYISQYNELMQIKAKRCATRYRIELRVGA